MTLGDQPSSGGDCCWPTLAVAVGLAACASSDASGRRRRRAAPVATATTIVGHRTSDHASATTVPTTTAFRAPTIGPDDHDVHRTATERWCVTDAEVADLEQQLDEIDQLLAGVDADLSQD